MKNIYLLVLSAVIFIQQSYAQGCVAIKSNGAICMLSHPDETDYTKGGWQFASSVRYFKSFRHFSGTTENKNRLVLGNEVINHQSSLDLSITRFFNERWSFMVDVPVLANSRSSLYEHGGKQRHSTHSFGVGDVRIAVYNWLLDPAKNHKGNIQVGLGIKLPTGDYNYKDYWYNVGVGGAKELRTVDQSIQLGDGGTGFTTEVNTFYSIHRDLTVYGNFYYLINPREQNGTRTYRELVSATLANEAIMSVPDQYMGRAGLTYSFRHIKGLGLSAGARLEGIPVHDLAGGSGDFRRPGYIWSVEPTITYTVKKLNFFAAVPFAVERNRTQSVTDKENSVKLNKHVQGDAAFADYTVNAGFSIRF
jgi:hypothetical protein